VNRIACSTLLAVLTAVPASAQAGPKEDLAEATRLLDNVEEEKAVPLLLKAIERKDATPTQLAEMWALVAVAKFNLRDEAGAKVAFRRALDADSSVSISKLLPPKGWAVFEQARVERERDLAAIKAAGAKDKPKDQPGVAPAATAAAKAEPKPSGLSPRAVAGIGVGAAGVVAAAVGVGLWANAGSLHSQAVAEPAAAKARDLYQSGSTQNSAGVGLLVGGAVAAAVGVVLFLLPDSGSEPAPAPTTTSVTVGPAGLAISGTF